MMVRIVIFLNNKEKTCVVYWVGWKSERERETVERMKIVVNWRRQRKRRMRVSLC